MRCEGGNTGLHVGRSAQFVTRLQVEFVVWSKLLLRVQLVQRRWILRRKQEYQLTG